MFKLDKKNNWLVVNLDGRITLPNSDSTKRAIKEELKKNDAKNCILSLKDVEYLDSTGVGVLISVYKALMEKQGKMVIAEASGIVRKVLDITKLHLLMPIYDTIDQALEAEGDKEES